MHVFGMGGLRMDNMPAGSLWLASEGRSTWKMCVSVTDNVINKK